MLVFIELVRHALMDERDAGRPAAAALDRGR